MKIIFNQIKVNLEYDENKLIEDTTLKYKIDSNDVIVAKILKKSIDSRKKELYIVYSIYFELKREYPKLLRYPEIKRYELKENLTIKKYSCDIRPIIIGAGPSGLFCALILARANLKPIIIEQGKKINERILDVNLINEKHFVNPYSNLLFGEGGAGTFSDGKLTTGIKSEYIRFILNTFIEHGANENIYYDQKPHIGTDVLRKVIVNIREKIESLGGEFLFSHQFRNFNVFDEYAIHITDLEINKDIILKTKYLVLATGHSLRKNYELLLEKNIEMKPKSFSMGVRIEHPKTYIDKIQLKSYANHIKLPYSEYKLAHHFENGRTLYTFCMCPGGEVVFSSHEDKRINVNGMSYQNRNLENSNSALLVNVNIEDYYKNSILDGLNYIEYYERKAYEKVKELKVPIQLLKDFLRNKCSSKIGSVKPSCKVGYKFVDLNEILPDFISQTIKNGVISFDKKMPGFLKDDAILTGIETRSSSPITIVRKDDLSVNDNGLYSIGEGSGYAGGITSSCVDGIKIAFQIIKELEKRGIYNEE